LISDKITKYKD